jgi:hypothetical protein
MRGNKATTSEKQITDYKMAPKEQIKLQAIRLPPLPPVDLCQGHTKQSKYIATTLNALSDTSTYTICMEAGRACRLDSYKQLRSRLRPSPQIKAITMSAWMTRVSASKHSNPEPPPPLEIILIPSHPGRLHDTLGSVLAMETVVQYSLSHIIPSQASEVRLHTRGSYAATTNPPGSQPHS